ncbi:unnamed protein product [Prunus armeniaca]
MTTRSKSGLCQKKSFEDYQCFTYMHDSTTLDEPSTFRVASFSPAWIKAMEEEIFALTMQGTWCLVPRPANTNIVGSKWIYKIKRNSDGTVSRYKARLVAQGFSQEAGFDYDETFSPVSKKQGSVSRSSTEAEYRALANASAEVAWIRQILADLHVFLPDPPLLFCDNMSALALSSNPGFHSRIKHLDVDFHFVRECVQRKDFLVHYFPTDEQVADVLTKGLHSPVFVKHCTNLSLGTLTEIERGCLPNG